MREKTAYSLKTKVLPTQKIHKTENKSNFLVDKVHIKLTILLLTKIFLNFMAQSEPHLSYIVCATNLSILPCLSTTVHASSNI